MSNSTVASILQSKSSNPAMSNSKVVSILDPKFSINPAMSNSKEILREERNLEPAHFTLKIESYSLLSNARGDNFESGSFSAGGYNWKLILYPNGNSDHGNGHISLYLAIDKPIGIDNWRIPVNFKLFVLNQITNQYLTIQDGSAVTDFHEQKPERGFRQFLSLQEFKNPSKGYLVNDCCTFGAEVFVLKPSPQKEILTMKRPADGKSYIWNIKKFSQLNDVQLSTEISVEGRKWTVSLYPKGNGSGSGEYLHLSMNLADWERVSPKRNVYAQYKLQVLGVNNVERESCHWFNSEDGWGYDLMLLKDIYKLPNGYLKDDTLTVHVEFQVISVTSSAEK